MTAPTMDNNPIDHADLWWWPTTLREQPVFALFNQANPMGAA
jgi:hypothetical protein